MKGLIIKEFLGLRRYFRILAVLMVLYIFMAFGMTSVSIFASVNAILIMICSLSSFQVCNTVFLIEGNLQYCSFQMYSEMIQLHFFKIIFHYRLLEDN